jgi:hypothetical protein
MFNRGELLAQYEIFDSASMIHLDAFLSTLSSLAYEDEKGDEE